MAAAKINLRKAGFFNPDLSPEDAKQAYLQRQERRLKLTQWQQQDQQQSAPGSSVSLNPLQLQPAGSVASHLSSQDMYQLKCYLDNDLDNVRSLNN